MAAATEVKGLAEIAADMDTAAALLHSAGHVSRAVEMRGHARTIRSVAPDVPAPRRSPPDAWDEGAAMANRPKQEFAPPEVPMPAAVWRAMGEVESALPVASLFAVGPRTVAMIARTVAPFTGLHDSALFAAGRRPEAQRSRLFGVELRVDEAVPEGTVEVRDGRGTVIQVINLGCP